MLLILFMLILLALNYRHNNSLDMELFRAAQPHEKAQSTQRYALKTK
jgi:hypothetical protein